MHAEYWLIYSYFKKRMCKPFNKRETMEDYIQSNIKLYGFKVIATTQVME